MGGGELHAHSFGILGGSCLSQWAALSGLGAAFFAACQASLRFNADRLRARIDDRRLIVASLGVAAAGFLVVASRRGLYRQRRRFRGHRLRHGSGGSLRLRAGGVAARRLCGGGAVHGGVLRLVRAPAGAAGHRRGRGRFFAVQRFRAVRRPARGGHRRDARFHSVAGARAVVVIQAEGSS